MKRRVSDLVSEITDNNCVNTSSVVGILVVGIWAIFFSF
jgi:hypothetical protein